MKKYFYFLLVLVVFNSCSSMSKFYQVYEVKSDEVPLKGRNFVFENEDVEVVYDFCTKGGSLSFVCRNKTDRTLYISMPNSFFIRNGIAYDYYEEKEYTNTLTEMSTMSYSVNYGAGISATTIGNISGISVNSSMSNLNIMSSALKNFNSASILESIMRTQTNSKTTGYSKSITKHTSKIIAIPPHSAKIIQSYAISTDYLIQCGIDKQTFYSNFPKKRSIIINYTKEDSPVVFRNHIAYSFKTDEDDLKTFDNSFFIASLQNFAEKEVFNTNLVNRNSLENRPYINPCDALSRVC